MVVQGCILRVDQRVQFLIAAASEGVPNVKCSIVRVFFFTVKANAMSACSSALDGTSISCIFKTVPFFIGTRPKKREDYISAAAS